MIEFAKIRTNTINEIVNEIINILQDVAIDKNILNQYSYQQLGKLWNQELSKHSTIDENTIKNIINLSKENLGISGKNLFIPLRIMLIGKEHGPDLYTIINFLGQQESIKRIKNITTD